jgi:DNA-binding NarL/FixJ family response regulator
METCAVRRVSIRVDGAQVAAGQQTVLLVTGDEDLRGAAARVLGLAGYEVIAASHSGHALLAGLNGRHIDVLLCELATDDVSGPALAERLRRHHPDLAAVYFANTGTPECRGVLVRPFTREDLLRGLMEVASLRHSEQRVV